MELKLKGDLSGAVRCMRSNRTFMELKQSDTFICNRRKNGSNRTFMELKLWNIGGHLLPDFSSNRTFMELKLEPRSECDKSNLCSNRTFMELKPPGAHALRAVPCVLIVPLWN